LVVKLGPVPTQAGELNAARIAEESCRIVGTPGFYTERKVGVDYIERFTPVIEQRLVTDAKRLPGLLNRVFR